MADWVSETTDNGGLLYTKVEGWRGILNLSLTQLRDLGQVTTSEFHVSLTFKWKDWISSLVFKPLELSSPIGEPFPREILCRTPIYKTDTSGYVSLGGYRENPSLALILAPEALVFDLIFCKKILAVWHSTIPNNVSWTLLISVGFFTQYPHHGEKSLKSKYYVS